MKILIIIIGSLFSISLNSQELSTYPGTPTTTFNRIDVQGDYVIASGSCDFVWFSKNGGVDWDAEYLNWLSLTGLKLFPNDPTKALIVSERKLKLFDMDEGVLETFDNTEYDLRDIKNIEISNDEIYVCNYTGLYKSNTNNIEWNLVWEAEPEFTNTPNIMVTTNDYIYITTFANQLIKINKSDHTVAKSNVFDNNLTELSMSTNTHGVAVLEGISKPIRTIDGWETFTILEEFNYGINVHSSGESDIFTIIGGTFQYSTDGGETVFEKNIDNNQINRIRDGIYHDDVIYIYGDANTFAKTLDYGENWIIPQSVVRSDFKTLSINENGIGYACGQGGNIVKTIDHGNTWEHYEHNINFDYEISSIVVLNNGDIVITDGGKLYILRDDLVLIENEISVQKLFKDRNDEFLLAHSFEGNSKYQINRSTDNGQTWEKVLDLPTYSSDINVGDNNNLYIVTNNGATHYLSIDKGISWDTLSIPLISQGYNVIDGISYSMGSNKLWRSNDEGQNWVEVHSGYLVKTPVKGPEGYLYTTTGANNETILYASKDNGLTWQIVWNFCAAPNQFIINQEGKIVITHDGGHINLYPRPIVNNVVDSYLTKDNSYVFPNPIHANEKLFFSIKTDQVDIIDWRGIMIKRYDKVNEHIELPSLNSGLYMIRYKTEGRFISKKLVIL